jgi:hypothetical protein
MPGSYHIEWQPPSDATWWDPFIQAEQLPFFYSLAWLRQFEQTHLQTRLLILSDADGETLLGWPMSINQRLGCRRILRPPLTPYNGPILVDPDGKNGTDALWVELYRVIRQDTDWAEARIWDHDADSSEPKADESTTEDTLIIPPLRDPDQRLADYDKQHRYDLRRAIREGLRVSDRIPPETLYRLWQRSLSFQEHRVPISESRWQTMQTQARDTDSPWQMHCLGIQTPTEEWAAGLALFYDQETAYLLISGVDRNVTDFAAGALLLQAAVEWCYDRRLRLDLEGSQVPGVRAFYEKFNPTVQTVKRYHWGPSAKLATLHQLTKLFNKPLYP